MNSLEEIIPATDRLLEELNLIKGGGEVTCDRGEKIVYDCRVGSDDKSA